VGTGVADGAGAGVAGLLAAGDAGAADGLAAGTGDCASAAPAQASAATGISAMRKEAVTFIRMVPMGRADQRFAAVPEQAYTARRNVNTRGPISSHDRYVMPPAPGEGVRHGFAALANRRLFAI
jgi:hypothetical protein